jgi:hypothetical protein
MTSQLYFPSWQNKQLAGIQNLKMSGTEKLVGGVTTDIFTKLSSQIELTEMGAAQYVQVEKS